MKKIYKLCSLLLISFFIISCQDDELNNPKIWLGNGTGFIYEDTTLLAPLDTFEIQLLADKGIEEFISLDFIKDDSLIKLTNNPFILEINGFENYYEENTINLQGMDKKGFTTKWKLVVPSNKSTHQQYLFKLKNKNGEEISTSFIIKTE